MNGSNVQMAKLGFMPNFRNQLLEHWHTGCKEDGHKISETADKADWLLTVIDGGTDNGEVCKVADDAPGGWLTVTTNDADNDAMELQMNGESFKCDRDIEYQIRVKIADVSTCDWFFGLAVADTDVLGGVTDSIGFRCPDATGDIDAVTELDSTETVTDTGANLADDTWVNLAFTFSAGDQKARFYVDGELLATHTTNLPTDEAMTPTFCLRAGTTVAQTAYWDYLYVDQQLQ